MTKDELLQKTQQFQRKIKDLQAHIAELNQEIRLLNQTYIKEHAKFEIKEKVKISFLDIFGGVFKEEFAFVSDIYMNGTDLKYSFKKCKKDGTMSLLDLDTRFIDCNVYKL